MNTVSGQMAVKEQSDALIQELYTTYAKQLISYTKRTYPINEEDGINLVYKTIYKIAAISTDKVFDNEAKRRAYVFKTHLNFLRNYFRDNKRFEFKNKEVALHEHVAENSSEEGAGTNPKLLLLEKLLNKLEDWQRILLLMRGQNVAYSEISKLVNKPEKQLKVYYGRLKKQLLLDMNEQIKTEKNGN